MSKEFKRPKLHDHDSSEHQPPVKRPSQAISEKPSTNDEDLEEPKKKISFGLPKAKGLLSTNPRSNLKTSSIKIKLNSAQKSISESVKFKPKLSSTALAFSSNDDDEEEEMPPEAKMRMKNIGRETPTSSGPNSFGKSRIGFCDSKKMYERKLRDMPKDDFDD